MKIIIVDDDPIVATSLKTIVESTDEVEVIAIGKNGDEATQLFEKHRGQLDIVLLDIQMPVKTGLQAAREILSLDSNAKVLFLTTFVDNEYIIEALNIGAFGYILKQDFDKILTALKAVSQGQNVFGTDIVQKLPQLMNGKTKVNYSNYDISKKEIEVIELVTQGLNNKEISEKLYLSEGTVRNYISGILEKLDLRDRTQLAIFALKQG